DAEGEAPFHGALEPLDELQVEIGRVAEQGTVEVAHEEAIRHACGGQTGGVTPGVRRARSGRRSPGCRSAAPRRRSPSAPRENAARRCRRTDPSRADWTDPRRPAVAASPGGEARRA